MSFNFLNLDDEIRELMRQEIQSDIDQENLYTSKRFTSKGSEAYPDLLMNAIMNGNEATLANDLRGSGNFKDQEERNTKNGVVMAKVPATAPDTFAEGEFNRFYMRGLCLKAMELGQQLEIYRARESGNPRSASLELIGQKMDPETLLNDLRVNTGVDTALGLPPGPNSGLSAKL